MINKGQKRQIVLDTETTGLEPEKGHRIIEIGCVELLDRQLTGNSFHKYVNPQRKIEEDSVIITGITNEFLRDKPIFSDILTEFLDYISGAEIIAHNANFDVGFINHEMRLASKKAKTLDYYVTVFDTLALARKKFPGQRNTLDAICKRYKIDLSMRKLHGHGALLDAQLLAEAYLLMTGGQCNLFTNLEHAGNEIQSESDNAIQPHNFNKATTCVTYAKEDEINAHNALLEKIKKSSGKCLWKHEEK
ncbi:MAG TPA: DNA polymerase III subunit epsilon [Coxiellaceae bacterium]|nr:MAG: DNA polymerase III subunit epsilon [Gammaproteobacteria bacterium RBG_16_37_9]HBC72143.1 DNA polymerase III subunit epsilon [Coxiellaceae bacterium]HBS52263.1 DNA polymerase III subunit epsilon [Coxiellaceae bacterium]HBY56190.1 DNA polymerase III subunit epsilon [Coxiellaceae bacterium]